MLKWLKLSGIVALIAVMYGATAWALGPAPGTPGAPANSSYGDGSTAQTAMTTSGSKTTGSGTAVSSTSGSGTSGSGTSGSGVLERDGRRVITLADNNTTLHLNQGESFLLDLGSGSVWQVTVANTNILARSDHPVPEGAQGIYVAKSAGTTELTAVTNYPCRQSIPPCGMPDRLFRLQVVVAATPAAPALVLVHGTVTAVDGERVTIQTPPTGPVCRPGQMCAQYLIAGRTIVLRLADAEWQRADGQSMSRISLLPGDEVAAAGTWADWPLANPPETIGFNTRVITLLHVGPGPAK